MPQRISTLRLAWTFLRIGAASFGGLGATLVLIEQALVGRQGVASRGDVAEALTHTKLLPGSTVVQVVAYLGYRLGGWAGSGAAALSFLLPSALAMLLLAYGYTHIAELPGIASIRRGVVAVVVALLLGTMSRLAAQVLSTPLARGLAVGAFIVVCVLPRAAPWVVLIAGGIGLIAHRRSVHGPR